MLEAMASGCLVIGSDTAPVREVIQHGGNGVLVDFFDVDQIADAVVSAMDPSDMHQEYRKKVRTRTAEHFNAAHGLEGFESLLTGLSLKAMSPSLAELH